MHSRTVTSETPKRARFRPEVDRALVARLQRGDPSAQDALVERLVCVPKLVRIRLRRHGVRPQAHLVSDISQEVFTLVWAHLDRYRGDAPLEAWVHGYVVRATAATVRRARDPRASANLEAIEEPEQPQDPANDELELSNAVEGLLGRLRPEDERVIRLRYFSKLGHAEIAETIGIGERAARGRFQRAMDRLRELAQGAEGLDR
ncbi:MAG: sigma-70 family RNA polymerase sigma factor [Planctomycetota bacterium]